MTSKPLFTFALASMLSIILSQGCAAQLALEERACPCAEGWTCCPSRNVCVGPGESCGSGLGALGSDGGGNALPTDSGDLSDAPPMDGAVSEGKPTLVARTYSGGCVAASGDRLYWDNGTTVVSALRNGAGDERLLLRRLSAIPYAGCSIAVDGTRLFVAVERSYVFLTPGVVEMSTDSSSSDPWILHQLPSVPSSFSISEDYVVTGEAEGGRITRFQRGSGQAGVVIATGLNDPAGVKVADKRVYVKEQSPASTWARWAIKSISLNNPQDAFTLGSNLDNVPFTMGGISATVFDGDGSVVELHRSAYYRTKEGIFQLPYTPPRTVWAGPAPYPVPIASDDKALYTEGPDSELVRVNPTDGRATTIHKIPRGIFSLGVDELGTYWIDSAGNLYSGSK